MEKFIRNRPVRLLLAFALVGIGAWAFLPYAVFRVAPSAFVNAELVRVTAPLSGRLSDALPAKGAWIDSPVKTALISAFLPDRTRLVTFEQQRDAANASVDLAAKQIDELIAADRDLAKRTGAHRTAMVERIRHEIQEADAELNACHAEERNRGQVRDRAKTLSESGIMTKLRLDEAQAAYEDAVSRCQALAARVNRLNGETRAARDGIFVQDGFNDAPYSEQQRDRLLLRRQELEAELLNDRSRLAGLQAEITEERSRLEQLSDYQVTLPAGHLVWNVLASPGFAVVEGQPVLDLADCGRRFLVVNMPERDFETINAGDEAAVRLLGTDDWLEGRVQQVRGSAARSDERLLAAQVPDPPSHHITVEVALPKGSLAKDKSRFCDIGRLAEVRFDRSTNPGAFLMRSWRGILAALGLHAEQVASRSTAVVH